MHGTRSLTSILSSSGTRYTLDHEAQTITRHGASSSVTLDLATEPVLQVGAPLHFLTQSSADSAPVARGGSSTVIALDVH